ncbi:Hypothetical predicted protein, partial [Paramuricea clavata]
MSNGKLYDIEKKLESYDNGWREFVSTHEKYLDVIDSENEKEAVYSLYEEQIKRRRERLALAQLKVDQIARKHELAKKMLDLQNESEMLEAEIQREEAMMSVSICEQAIREEREHKLGDIEELNENNGQGRLDNAPTRSVQGEEGANEGYCVAKKTLTENFGKPHIIARAHIKKLVNLPSIKKAGGPSLLEFTRHLESTNRTLKGMGPEHVSDLDHLNTLKELNRKLPMFMKARWTEEAGKIYERNSTSRFEDFLNFIKKKATLVNNEFGDDLTSSDSKDRAKEKWRNNERK